MGPERFSFPWVIRFFYHFHIQDVVQRKLLEKSKIRYRVFYKNTDSASFLRLQKWIFTLCPSVFFAFLPTYFGRTAQMNRPIFTKTSMCLFQVTREVLRVGGGGGYPKFGSCLGNTKYFTGPNLPVQELLLNKT